MCGIAGYSTSQDWRDEYITSPEVQKKILNEAWLHNLHRGGDAAGYFALKDDGKIKVYKNKGPADHILENNLKSTNPPVSNVFGAHTRAKTRGDEKNNRNNHPVYFGGVFANHNGTIRNDDEIKKWVPKDKGNDLPEVDSVAIPIVLSQAGSPYDVPVIADLLEDLDGGFAFHAVWRDHPGLSLFARGTGSPLIIAQHTYGAVLYASEVEALWGMIGAMGLKPDGEGWEYYSMKTNTFMLVENGIPIAWDDFTPPPAFNRVSDVEVYRMLPEAGPEKKAEVVYSTNLSNDFAVKHGEKGRDLNEIEDKNKEELYGLDIGFTQANEQFPQKSDFSKFSVFSEADSIIKNKVSGKMHVFFGDVEIITDGRTVSDVYDHSKFKTEQRWYVEDKTKEQDDDGEIVVYPTFSNFLEENASKVLQSPRSDAEYKYKKKFSGQSNQGNVVQGNFPSARNNGGRRQLPLGATGGVKITGATTPDSPDDLEYLKPDPLLTYANIWDQTIDHADREHANNGFFFLSKNLTCSQHNNMPLWKHLDPHECKICVASAAYTLSCVADLKMLSFVLTNSVMKDYVGENTACDEADDHDWFGSLYAEIHLASGKYFDIVIGEECVYCRAKRELSNLPWWLIQIIARKKDVMFYSC